jgi:hypothetical protein
MRILTCYLSPTAGTATLDGFAENTTPDTFGNALYTVRLQTADGSRRALRLRPDPETSTTSPPRTASRTSWSCGKASGTALCCGVAPPSSKTTEHALCYMSTICLPVSNRQKWKPPSLQT